MFWSKIAGLYDLFENIYNRKVYKQTGERVAEYINSTDTVLECACGTGAISVFIARKCKKLYATDFATGMLKQAQKKLKDFQNVKLKQADITAIKAKDNTFDVVVAGNVIHLLPNPEAAMKELTRVCKDGGKLIIPTYINNSANSSRWAVKFLAMLGVNFKRQFDEESYKAFFKNMGYNNVKYTIVRGHMSCDIAIIEIRK